MDEEELSLELLYRNYSTFCVGHGCAGNWDEKNAASRVHKVFADVLPMHQTPSTTPDIRDEDGNEIKVAMAPLAGLVPDDDGYNTLELLINYYEKWIDEKKGDATQLATNLIPAANKNIANAETCAKRMQSGLQFLRTNKIAAEAFKLANKAILMQQLRPKDKRPTRFDINKGRHEFEEYNEIDPLNPGKNRGSWRAFQMAFLIMAVESTAIGNIPDREIVELIWFPTGGGKTEAYLGLIAFSIFLRRLKDPEDQGVNVIMRYTLRLLTTQQFQRASKLILAMEVIRLENPESLGEKEFSIGLWVGSKNTPNTKERRNNCVSGTG